MYNRHVLDNNLRILTASLPYTRAVSMGIFTGVGSRYEEDKIAGISHFIEHMMFKGTEKRPTPKHISDEIENVGGIYNAFTGRERTVYWAKVADTHFPIALDVLVDMLLNSRLAPEHIEKERGVIIEEINMSLDTPDDLVHILANELIRPGHPLGRDIAGYKEMVAAMTRGDLLSYIDSYYRPGNTVISVAGNIDEDDVIEQLATRLNTWTSGSTPDFMPFLETQDEPRLNIYNKQTEQLRLCLKLSGFHRQHPDRFKLRILNVILGAGMSSRLFQRIREEMGLAYSVHSWARSYQDTGEVGIFAGVPNTKGADALQAILEELDRMCREPVTDAELMRSKEFTKGHLLLGMEDSFSIAAWAGDQEVLSNQILSVEEVVAEIDAVTIADVQEIARQLFKTEKLNLAVVGPARDEDFRPLLKL